MNRIKCIVLSSLVCFMAGAAAAGVVAHYTFDDAANLSTNTGSAELVWANTSRIAVTDGVFSNAAAFLNDDNSINYIIEDLTPAALDYSSFSISMHVRCDPADEQKWKDFITIGSGVGQLLRLEMTGAGTVALFSAGTPGGSAANFTGSTVIRDTTWHHIGLVSDGSMLTLYVDGVAETNVPYTGSGIMEKMQLGSQYGEPVWNNRSINADIDDLVIADTPLAANEMAWLAANAWVDGPPIVPDPVVLFIESGVDSVNIGTTNLSAAPGVTNFLQYKTDLIVGTWINLHSATGVTSTNWTVTVTPTKRFFRVETTY